MDEMKVEMTAQEECAAGEERAVEETGQAIAQEENPEESFEALVKGKYKAQFDARVQKIIEARLKAVRRENESLRSSAEGRGRQAREMVERLAAQAESIRQVYGEFDWKKEMRSELFSALIAAGVEGRSAYEAVHHRELLRKAMVYGAQQAGERIARTMAYGRGAEENSGGTPTVTHADPRHLSHAEREDIRRRVMRGEKVRF